MLAALMTRPAGALLSTPTVHLYTSATSPPSPTSTVADFTEATFAGYAASVIAALVGPVNLPNAAGQGVLQTVNFVGGAIVSPGQTVIGYWIDDGATAYYLGEAFPNPVLFVNPGDFLDLAVIFPVITPAQVQ
jgi:hypothetical protein